MPLLFAGNPVPQRDRTAVGASVARLPRLAFFFPVVLGIAAMLIARSLASQ